MEKRLRTLLAVVVTMVMVLQSLAPAIAQDAGTDATPATQSEEGSGATPGEGEGEGSPETPVITYLTLPTFAVEQDACEDVLTMNVGSVTSVLGVSSVTTEGSVTPGSTVTVNVSFLEGYTLDTLNSAGWTLNGDGTATSQVVVPNCVVARGISPMAIELTTSAIKTFVVNPNSISSFDTSVKFTFTYEVRPAAGSTLQSGDTVLFFVDGFSALETSFVGEEGCIPLEQASGPPIGCVEIDAAGNGKLVLNDVVNGKSFAQGGFYFQQDSHWAEKLQQDDSRDILFTVEQTGKDDLPGTLSIPGRPKVTPTPIPDPQTNPRKSGWFSSGDQGRQTQKDAIVWTVYAPYGPAAGAELTDEFTATDGFATWAFDCATLKYQWYSAKSEELGTVTCADGKVTVKWGAYPANTDLAVYLYGTVTDPNNQENPADGSLKFTNTVNSKVWKVGQNPATDAPFGTGQANATVIQSSTGPGVGQARNFNKSGGWGPGTTQGRTDGENMITWEVRAPSGPSDGTTITDTIQPATNLDGSVTYGASGWEFDCSTWTALNTTSWPGGAADPPPTLVSCTPTEVVVSIGKYREIYDFQTPGFRIQAKRVMTGPNGVAQPIYERDALIFNNKATAVTKPWQWSGNEGDLHHGTATANKKQDIPVEPLVTPTKDAKFVRRDAGKYNPQGALKWTITLPAGPNGRLELTDTAEANRWQFDCSKIVITGANGLYDPIDCSPGALKVVFPDGYGAGVTPTIDITVDLLVEYKEENWFSNTVSVKVWDYLENSKWNEGLTWKEGGATKTIRQQASSGGTGEIGEFKVSIGDYVWFDENADGLQNEPAANGIKDVKVELFKKDGTKVGETTTDANGYYWFTSLDSSAEYYLIFHKPEGYDGWTIQNAGNVAQDSDVDPATGRVDFTAPAFGDNNPGPRATDNPTFDAGLIINPAPKVVSIGDYVWYDENKDGIQNEPASYGIKDVKVELFLKSDNSRVGETLTDADGYYGFDDLDPETEYYLIFTKPTGYDGWTTQGAGDDDAKDSDVNAAGRIDFVSPESGENQIGHNVADDPTLDAGLIRKPVSIGDYVWYDENKDGIQNEPASYGIKDVKVELYRGDTKIGETLTDADGYYGFKDLVPGVAYKLVFKQPAGYAGWTTQNAGADDAKDSDVNTAGVIDFTSPIAPNNNLIGHNVADNPTLDAGLVKAGVSIGDYVWYDENKDGVQNEPASYGIKDVKVELYRGDTKIGETLTDADGYYGFKDLVPDAKYKLVFTQPSGYAGWTIQNAGADDAKDSDVNPAGEITFTSPATGENKIGHNVADDPTLDAGLIKKPVSVGDYVWYDENRDGIQNEGPEFGIKDVKVELYRGDTKIGETLTDADGYYGFKDLVPDAKYKLVFTQPAGYDGWTTQNAGADDAKDSDVNPAGEITFTSPATGENKIGHNVADNPTLDAGVVKKPVSIGDYVWFDFNRDGIQNEDASYGIGGVKVDLYRGDTKIGETTTDSSGYYGFKDLVPSVEYKLVFTEPTGYDGWTTQNAGADDAKDSDVNPAGEITFTTPATGVNKVGQNVADDPTLDAGLVVKKVSIGDYVWYDTNLDGLQGGDEAPASGIKVTLYKDGSAVDTTTTDSNGFYYFKDLEPKSQYSLTFEKPDGYAWTIQNAGDDAADSDVDTNGQVTFTTPEFGKNHPLDGVTYVKDMADDPTLDAGLIRLVSVGDYVWFDQNKDGIQSEGEVPVAGVVVTLYKADGSVVGTTTTDVDGYYGFKDLMPNADYYLIFEKPDGYAGWTQQYAGDDTAVDSNVDPATGRVDFTSEKYGENKIGHNVADDPTLDGGLIRLVSIGDYVWYDANSNGKQDPGEKPAKDIKVELFDKDGNKVGETTTDGDGYYYFKDLEPSTQYKLKFTKPTGYTWTRQDAGDNDEIDSDVDINGEITFITPEKGNNLIGPNMADNPTLDAGLVLIPSPDEPPVVKELPKTGSGAESSSVIVLATLAGAVMMAGAVRLSVNKRT